MALALVASLVSIWTGISVALIEILVGVVAGNFLHLQANTDWINFLALLGSDQRQYTILVTVMILSAFVPTLIAQKFFQPTLKTMRAWGRLYRRKETFRSALEAVRN